MTRRVRWWITRARQTLWARPLVYAALAVAAVLLCLWVDRRLAIDHVPAVNPDTVGNLLAIIATSMLTVATFAVASMVAAYASAGSTATPRAFTLVLADDVSQTALSGFVGMFIFSVVALVSLETGLYGRVGVFLIFALTILAIAFVVALFVRWVDRIARLGRLGHTIDLVEHAAAASLDARRRHPALGGRPRRQREVTGTPVFATSVGYVQSIDMAALQRCGASGSLTIDVDAVPGTFVGPGRALALVEPANAVTDAVRRTVAAAFRIGDDRTFADDPRFGLVTLAEIAARALSPAINDAGTAIDIIGTFVRLLTGWARASAPDEVLHDRVFVPALSASDMFDDAFTAIARDGAGMIEVQVRVQKAFIALASTDNAEVRSAAVAHARLAHARARPVLALPEEQARIADLVRVVEEAARQRT